MKMSAYVHLMSSTNVFMKACGIACRHQATLLPMQSTQVVSCNSLIQPVHPEAALALAPQVLCARGVLAMDMNGLSDPYCKARWSPLFCALPAPRPSLTCI